MSTRNSGPADAADAPGVTPDSYEHAHDVQASGDAQTEHSGQMRLPLGTGIEIMRAEEANRESTAVHSAPEVPAADLEALLPWSVKPLLQVAAAHRNV